LNNPKIVRRRILLVFLLSLLALGAAIAPRYLRVLLSRELTHLFGMKVTMDGCDILWTTGEISIRNLRFHNQPEFTNRPHLFVAEMRVRPDWPQLLNKRIHIFDIRLNRPVYLLERKVLKDDVHNNIVTWWHWMKAQTGLDKDDDSSKPSTKSWSLLIDHIDIVTGEFMFDQYGIRGSNRRYFFREMQGYLNGLRWPDPAPENLDQTVYLKGLFGERFPTPFEIKGRASFATYNVSFDLHGTVHNGAVLDYDHFWNGLPVRVRRGQFDLNSHVICLRRSLRSQNRVWMKNLSLASRRTLGGTIWGMPLKTWMRFIETEKTIRLNVSLRGDIESPTLASGEAFQDAFQEALKEKTQKGIHFVTDGAIQLATQTGSLVMDTPGRLVDGIGKIASLVPVSKMELPKVFNKTVSLQDAGISPGAKDNNHLKA